jgi:protein phosphatase 1 regulatory subunit 7
MSESNANNNNSVAEGGDNEDHDKNYNNTNNPIKTATVDTSTLPLDWTKLGQQPTEDEPKEFPVRYPHDVMEWSVEDEEIYSVGTAGQKITILGDDFKDPQTTNFNVQTLVLRSHLIKDMGGLGHLTKLQLLELYDNMVQSFDEETMRGCGPSLRTLDMSYNAIRDMTPVSYCATNLTELYLANNKLKEITGLSTLKNLKKLDLGANRIRVMDPNELCGLVNLEELWIGKNKIEEINGLEKVRVNNINMRMDDFVFMQ